MSDEKKTPLEDLLRSLEGHIVDSVEIKGEHILVCEGNEGDILHVRISATKLDPEHVRLDSKILSFSILEADLLSRILGYIHNLQSLQEVSKSSSEMLSDLKRTRLMDVCKLLDHIKGTIAETLRIRKPPETGPKTK